MRRPVVFLHIPKTGGQTIHHAIGSKFPPEERSPIRLMSQVGTRGPFPPQYRFHSGHLNWSRLEEVKDDPFIFTVLRDPRERLGSFYFYMRAEMERRVQEAGVDSIPFHQRALLGPADDFFFPAEEESRLRLRRTWENVMTNFFAFRSLSRPLQFVDLPPEEMLIRARQNAGKLSAIYLFGNFSCLEDDLEAVTGHRIQIDGRDSNKGPLDAAVSRWAALLGELESDVHQREIERFVNADVELLDQLGLRALRAVRLK